MEKNCQRGITEIFLSQAQGVGPGGWGGGFHSVPKMKNTSAFSKKLDWGLSQFSLLS